MLGKEKISSTTDRQQNFVVSNTDKLPDHAAKKILIAEDDASVRRFLEVILRRAGYEVWAAEDGAIAVQKAFEINFELIILDAVMPNLSGSEAGRILRGHPSFKNIPIVILSGLDTETGFDASARLLKTPNMQEELLAVVARLLAAEN